MQGGARGAFAPPFLGKLFQIHRILKIKHNSRIQRIITIFVFYRLKGYITRDQYLATDWFVKSFLRRYTDQLDA